MYEIKTGVDGKQYFVFANSDDAWDFHDKLNLTVYEFNKTAIFPMYCFVTSFGQYENAVGLVNL